MICLGEAMSRVASCETIGIRGAVAALRGLTVLVDDLPVVTGALVVVDSSSGPRTGEVVGFDGGRAVVMLLGQTAGVRAGDRVRLVGASPQVRVGASMLGRVVDALGRPIDDGPALRDLSGRPLSPDPVTAMKRRRITEPLRTGVRAIDLFNTVGRGQRLGVFAGPGVGKSTLMGMIARRSAADVNVIGLIGERGREVKDFIEHALGVEGMRRSVVVVATGDESPLMRVRAAMAACAAAEHFRDRGLDVMLMLDSVTRFAHAQRQVGLAVGEPPATKGYTPSVFAMLPLLLERAGAIEVGVNGGRAGSITGFYTILVEGDDMTEPIADAARGILDGHLVLSRRLAHKGHFPAVDPLDSVSRLMSEVADAEHNTARRRLVSLLAAHREAEDLIQIGAYAPGSNPTTDAAIQFKPRIDAMLQQRVDEAEPFDVARARMVALSNEATAFGAAAEKIRKK
ncbi:MAG: FliI/YscN family ATPase [Phycisphaerales bacterium]